MACAVVVAAAKVAAAWFGPLLVATWDFAATEVAAAKFGSSHLAPLPKFLLVRCHHRSLLACITMLRDAAVQLNRINFFLSFILLLRSMSKMASALVGPTMSSASG